MSETPAHFPWTLQAMHFGSFLDAQFTVRGRTLLPGDAILFYTDGVTEARWNGEMFGEDRLVSLLAGCARSSASEIVDVISTAVAKFGPEVRDDIALLVLKVSEPAS